MTYFQKSGNKYHATRSEYDGIIYHSKFEAAYAKELDIRKKVGEILEWDRQVKIPLEVNGQHICDYYVDFRILYPDGHTEFVECKGFATPVFRIKWKLFEALYGNNPKVDLTIIKQSQWKHR